MSKIILWNDTEPVEIVDDAMEAIETRENNGEEVLDFVIPVHHRHAHLIQNERVVQISDGHGNLGEKFWIRRTTRHRTRRDVQLQVYAEARFYILALGGQVADREFEQEQADAPMQVALSGTDWVIGTIEKTTRRSLTFENLNPLEALRKVASVHGGDLVFDNEARTVSLKVQQGENRGVGFFLGNGLVDSQRIVDTTSLVTRITPRNADGIGIESVNNGVPYVEDYSWTSELREATYDFSADTSPIAMLNAAQMNLARRSSPNYTYNATVEDLSLSTGDQLDRFYLGDRVLIRDHEIGIETTQRIVKLEIDHLRPWQTKITLSSTLRELGDSEDDENDTTAGTGAGAGKVFDLVPFNLLRNGRFDNDLAHWAHQGATLVPAGRQATGTQAVEFAGAGEHWIEQTFQPDNRTEFTLSFDVETDGPQGFVPDLVAEAQVQYEDGTVETITIELS